MAPHSTETVVLLGLLKRGIKPRILSKTAQQPEHRMISELTCEKALSALQRGWKNGPDSACKTACNIHQLSSSPVVHQLRLGKLLHHGASASMRERRSHAKLREAAKNGKCHVVGWSEQALQLLSHLLRRWAQNYPNPPTSSIFESEVGQEPRAGGKCRPLRLNRTSR